MVPRCKALKQFSGRNQLVGVRQLDHHLPIGGLVEGVDSRLDHMGTQRSTGIGLHSPANRCRLRMNSGGAQRHRRRTRQAGIFYKIAS
jgi:hypothetical protein